MSRTRSLIRLSLVILVAVLGTAVGTSLSGAHAAPRISISDTAQVRPDFRSVSAQVSAHSVIAARAEAAAQQTRTTVRPGATLSSIAAALYGSASDWPSLWWLNRSTVHNPNDVRVGQVLITGPRVTQTPAITSAAMAALPHLIVTTAYVRGNSSLSFTSAVKFAPAPSSAGIPGGALGYCIKTHEEGLSWAWGPGDGGGGYQFHFATWVEFGGAPGEYGVAGAAYQNSVFAHALAVGGASNWTLYDGC